MLQNWYVLGQDQSVLRLENWKVELADQVNAVDSEVKAYWWRLWKFLTGWKGTWPCRIDPKKPKDTLDAFAVKDPKAPAVLDESDLLALSPNKDNWQLFEITKRHVGKTEQALWSVEAQEEQRDWT